MEIWKIYNAGYNKEKKRFECMTFEMQRLDEIGKAFYKARFITDKKEKRDELRRLLKAEKTTPKKREVNQWQTVFNNYDDFEKYSANNTLFYGNDVNLSSKRLLEIEVYTLERLKKLEDLKETEKVDFLINEMFKVHVNILDEPKADFVFRNEINALIFKVFETKLKELSKIEVMEFNEQMSKAVNRSLSWNAQKNIIGTLFGVLHEAKAIKGTKADMIKAICAMFPNLKESTIKDGVNFRVYKAENKYYYSRETKELLTGFSEFLKNKNTK